VLKPYCHASWWRSSNLLSNKFCFSHSCFRQPFTNVWMTCSPFNKIRVKFVFLTQFFNNIYVHPILLSCHCVWTVFNCFWSKWDSKDNCNMASANKNRGTILVYKFSSKWVNAYLLWIWGSCQASTVGVSQLVCVGRSQC